MSRETVYTAAQKLVKLGQDLQPGLSTWHEAIEKAYQELISEVLESKESPHKHTIPGIGEIEISED